MKEPIVYLDSSAIIKRYIREPGSEVVRDIYLKTYSGENRISFSIWNIGEVLGAFDRAWRIGRLDQKAYSLVKRRFLLETKRLLKLGVLILVPIKIKILRRSWNILEKYHIYVADALQIASAIHVNASKFITGDSRLHKAASKELNSILLD